MTPLPEIADAWRQPFGVYGDAQRVGLREQMRRDAFEQHPGAGVGMHDLPAAVDYDTRKWVVGVQNSLDALPDSGHVGVGEGALPVHRRQTGGHQQLVPFAKRHVEHAGEAQHHPARLGAAGPSR